MPNLLEQNMFISSLTETVRQPVTQPPPPKRRRHKECIEKDSMLPPPRPLSHPPQSNFSQQMGLYPEALEPYNAHPEPGQLLLQQAFHPASDSYSFTAARPSGIDYTQFPQDPSSIPIFAAPQQQFQQQQQYQEYQHYPQYNGNLAAEISAQLYYPEQLYIQPPVASQNARYSQDPLLQRPQEVVEPANTGKIIETRSFLVLTYFCILASDNTKEFWTEPIRIHMDNDESTLKAAFLEAIAARHKSPAPQPDMRVIERVNMRTNTIHNIFVTWFGKGGGLGGSMTTSVQGKNHEDVRKILEMMKQRAWRDWFFVVYMRNKE